MLPYLGCTVALNNINWESLYGNMRKAQQRWGIVVKVMTKKGAIMRAHAMIYKVAFQAVLLYGSKRWILTEEMLKVMEGFHHQIACRIAGMSDQQLGERVC